MLIQLHDLRRQPEQDLDFQETFDLNNIHPNLEGEALVHAKARAHYDGEHYVLNGQLSTTLTLICSKCLTTYEWPLNIDWYEEFSQEESPEEADDTDVRFIDEDEVDINPYIREALLLEIPFVPVCREDCQGLCPSCGIDRNEASCDCTHERIDPRLAELQKFFSSEDQDKY